MCDCLIMLVKSMTERKYSLPGEIGFFIPCSPMFSLTGMREELSSANWRLINLLRNFNADPHLELESSGWNIPGHAKHKYLHMNEP